MMSPKQTTSLMPRSSMSVEHGLERFQVRVDVR